MDIVKNIWVQTAVVVLVIAIAWHLRGELFNFNSAPDNQTTDA